MWFSGLLESYFNQLSKYRKKTYIIQGLGNVGFYAAKYLDALGCIMVGCGDHTDIMLNNSNKENEIQIGIPFHNIEEHIKKHKSHKF